MTAPVDDRCTAAHELGHAFAMREAGLTPGRIVVHRIMGGGSCTAREDSITPEQFWPAAVMTAAGRAGEELYREYHEISSPWSWGTEGDEANFLELLKDASELGICIGPWEAAVSEARVLLEVHWEELDALVLPLAYTGTMNGLPV